MSRPKSIKLPALDLSKSVSSPLRPRPRSASIVKVEEVGDRSVDEFLDRSAYANINADWVNAKGVCLDRVLLWFHSYLSATFARRMAHTHRPHNPGENHCRHDTWNDAANQLDGREFLIPGCK